MPWLIEKAVPLPLTSSSCQKYVTSKHSDIVQSTPAAHMVQHECYFSFFFFVLFLLCFPVFLESVGGKLACDLSDLCVALIKREVQ